MIAIIDYGMGNLRSAQKGLERAGHDAIVTEDPEDVARASGIVVPGVGAFKDCYDGLVQRGFLEPVLTAARERKPLLGICVGMQMLFDESEEGEGSPGLGLLPGKVVRFRIAPGTGLKVPHMGWNELDPVPNRPCAILRELPPNPYVYFVHSYHPIPERESDIYATSDYGGPFACVVGRDRIFGVQFHPEKSQAVGLGILKAFGDYVHENAVDATLRA